MEYHGKCGHTLVRIQHVALLSRIKTSYATCCLATQTVSATIPGFQCINLCAQYMASHPYKPIFYTSNYYYISYVIRLTWCENQLSYIWGPFVYYFHDVISLINTETKRRLEN